MLDWQHQTDKPLFPDVIWSRPENKNGAGKILAVGGGGGSIAKFAGHYAQLSNSSVGTIYLLAPESLKKITSHIPEISFAPSTPSGSFAKPALGEIMNFSANVDSVYLAGDIGKNSETEVMLQSFFKKFFGLVFISRDSIESLDLVRDEIIFREKTIIFMDLRQVQVLGKQLGQTRAITSTAGRAQLAEALAELGGKCEATFVIDFDEIWVVQKDRIIDAKNINFSEEKALTWATQQPEKLFESLVSSCV